MCGQCGKVCRTRRPEHAQCSKNVSFEKEKNEFRVERAFSYVRLELQSLLALFRDKPGLLGPKMTLLLSGLAFAREELMWLARHQTGPLPRSSKLRTEDFEDKRFTDILYLVNQLISLLRTHAGLVKRFLIFCFFFFFFFFF
jgi:hypothetical protein